MLLRFEARKLHIRIKTLQPLHMTILLKFRYFFLIILLLGCRDTKSPDAQPKAQPQEEVPATETDEKGSATILFFGDSLTAGYGLEPEQAFPALIASRLDSLGYSYEVVNAGLSGETTASGVNRLDWVLRQPVRVFVLELGANDGLRGIPLSETRKNLSSMIETVQGRFPEVEILLAGMQLPPNMGPEYTQAFRAIFPELTQIYDLHLIPFLLDGVGGIPELNQVDGIHPTAEGHEILAENVWKVLEPALEEISRIEAR